MEEFRLFNEMSQERYELKEVRLDSGKIKDELVFICPVEADQSVSSEDSIIDSESLENLANLRDEIENYALEGKKCFIMMDYEKALRFFKKSYKNLRTFYKKDQKSLFTGETATILLFIGETHQKLRNFSDGLNFNEKSLEISGFLEEDNTELLVNTLVAKASLLLEIGEAREAGIIINTCEVWHKSYPNAEGMTQVQKIKGKVLAFTGKYYAADEIYWQIFNDFQRKTLGSSEEFAEYLQFLIDFSEIQTELNSIETAEKLLKAAEKFAKSVFNPNDKFLLKIQSALCNLYLIDNKEGIYHKKIKKIQKIKNLLSLLFPAKDLSLYYLRFSSIFLDKSQVILQYSECKIAWESALHPYDINLAYLYSDFGVFYLDLGDYQRAIDLLTVSKTIYIKRKRFETSDFKKFLRNLLIATEATGNRKAISRLQTYIKCSVWLTQSQEKNNVYKKVADICYIDNKNISEDNSIVITRGMFKNHASKLKMCIIKEFKIPIDKNRLNQELNFLNKIALHNQGFIQCFGDFEKNSCIYMVLEDYTDQLSEIVEKSPDFFCERELKIQIRSILKTFQYLEEKKIYYGEVDLSRIYVTTKKQLKLGFFQSNFSFETDQKAKLDPEQCDPVLFEVYSLVLAILHYLNKISDAVSNEIQMPQIKTTENIQKYLQNLHENLFANLKNYSWLKKLLSFTIRLTDDNKPFYSKILEKLYNYVDYI